MGDYILVFEISWVDLALIALIVSWGFVVYTAVLQLQEIPWMDFASPVQEMMATTSTLDPSGNRLPSDPSGNRLPLDPSGCASCAAATAMMSTTGNTIMVPTIMNPSTTITSTYIKS